MRPSLAVVVLGLLLAPWASAQGNLAPSPHTRTCFLDVDGDGVHGASEPIYLQVASCGAGVAAGDARLTPNAGFPGGTLVTGAHDDFGPRTVVVASAYGFFDGDGDGGHSPSESVVLHFGAVPGPVLPGDVPLDGPDAFQPIPGSDSRVGTPLAATGVPVGGESFSDRDGSAGYSVSDLLFLDLDGNLFVSIGDLRLAGPVSTPAATTTSASTTGAPSDTTFPHATVTSTSASDAGPSPIGPSQGSPGPGLALAVLAGGLALWVRARRRSH